MKQTIFAILLASAAGTASANQPFDFQQRFGSEEYVHGASAAHIVFAPVAPSDLEPSLNALMLSANVDGIAANDFDGTIINSGPSRISLWEVQRGSPEATAYRGYYERYPADTDWARVAREHRDSQMSDGIAAEPARADSRS